jgi:NADPH:quinone reductase-like Zn-dependent oxidoreductase
MIPQKARKMQAWQIHGYGDLDELQLDDNIKIPPLKNPSDILVKVSASSVNPIDIAMISRSFYIFIGPSIELLFF